MFSTLSFFGANKCIKLQCKPKPVDEDVASLPDACCMMLMMMLLMMKPDDCQVAPIIS